MFETGEEVIIADTFEVGIIVAVGDGTYTVQTDTKIIEVSEFDVIPNDLEDDFIPFLDDDDDLYEDLQPFRNMNQGYY